MTYPILYKKDETDFFNTGLGPLKTAISGGVREDLNGIFYLEGEVLVDDEVFSKIEENSILKVNAGRTLKDQRFRIKRIVPNSKGTASIYAEHVSYITKELAMKPIVNILTLNCHEALRVWKSAILDDNELVVSSDISTVSSTNWHIRDVKNPREALGGVKGSLLDTYGGEYKFDNYHISLLKKRGKTANTVLAYGRNITDLEQERNITETYTSVYPYAIYNDENQNEQLVTINKYVVDCDNINEYPNKNVLIVDFSSEFEQEEIPTPARLEKLAKDYIKNNDIGKPNVSIKLSFVDLSQTADYKALALLEEVDLGDDVLVYYPKLDINTTAKVVSVEWNFLADRYESIEIGSKRASLSSVIADQQVKIKEIESQSNVALTAANGKNTVFYGLYGQDGLGEPTAIKVGDMWYKPRGEDTELYIWDGNIWRFEMSTAPDPTIAKKIEELEKETAENREKIEETLKKSEQAISDAGFAKDVAGESTQIANQAIKNAEQAKKDAQKAIDNLENLSIGGRNYIILNKLGSYAPYNTKPVYSSTTITTTITNDNVHYLTLSVGGFTPSNKIYTLSGRIFINDEPINSDRFNTKFMSTYNKESETFSVDDQGNFVSTEKYTGTSIWIIHTRIKKLKKGDIVTIEKLKFEEGNVKTDYTPATEDTQIQINNLNGELTQKVSQTDYNNLDSKVSSQVTQILQNKSTLEIKANKTDVDTLNNKVATQETKITQTVSELALKASKTDVDLLNNKVSDQSAQIKVQSNEISGLITKTDTQTTEINSLKITSDKLSSTISKVETDFDNLSIGGRNYIILDKLGSYAPYNAKPTYSGTTITTKYVANQENNILTLSIDGFTPSNKIYTLSGRILINDEPINSDRFNTKFMSTYNKESETFSVDDQGNFVSTEKYTGTSIWIIHTHIKKLKKGDVVTIEKVKFEEGNIKTDYTPATEELATQTQYTKLEQTLSGLQSTVNNKADQSQVTQLATQVTTVVKDTEDNKAQLTILKSDINLKVQKNDVINQINISTEAITIAGKKIQITGDTYISNGVIKSAMIADAAIDSAKIQDASITNAKIANLDISKATMGYLNSDRIQTRSITADKLTSNAIQVGFNAMGNAIKISPYDLSFYRLSQLSSKINDEGVTFWYGNRYIGGMGEVQKQGNTNVRGIANHLSHQGDFISWGYKKVSTDTYYTSMLTLDPKGLYTGTAGIHFDSDIAVKDAFRNLRFMSVTLGGTKYPAITDSEGYSGILFGVGQLFLMEGKTCYPLNKIGRLANALSGIGSVSLATSMQPDGKMNTWKTLTL